MSAKPQGPPRKGANVSSVELPVLSEHALETTERRRRGVARPVTAALLSAALLAGVAGPASAATRQSARTAPFSLGSGDNTLAAVESTLVANLNEVSGHGLVSVHGTRGGVVVDVAQAALADAQSTTITVLPGITLTISSTGIELSLSAQVVTEIQTGLDGGEEIAEIVGSILDLAGVPLGSDIADIVSAALGLGSDLLQVCTAPDGSASFTVSWSALPSCSGLALPA